MLINEKEKFDLLLSFVRQHKKVYIFRRDPKDGEYPVGGNIRNWNFESITLRIPKDPSEKQWSEIAAILLHEYGHTIGETCNERKAWKHGENFVKKYCNELMPLHFEETKMLGLSTYIGTENY